MTKSTYTKIKFAGLSVVVPDYPHSVDEDIHFFDNNKSTLARAKKIVGYGTRYVCPKGLTPTDLSTSAAKRLISEMDLDTNELDALIFVVQNPDYTVPGSSFIIHKELQLPNKCASIDINQGCPGFVYGLWLAGGLIESGACKKILLVAGDSAYSDKATRGGLLFGDAGAAALIVHDEQAEKTYFNVEADGKLFDALIIPSSGARLPIQQDTIDLIIKDKQNEDVRLTESFMDGLAVFNFSIKDVPHNILELLEYANIKQNEIDFAAFHQANKQIVEHIASKSGLTPEQFTTKTFSEYGNQSTASVPGVIAHILADRARNSKLKTLLCGYGVGAAWASCLINLDHLVCSGITKLKFNNLKTREEIKAYWINKIGGQSDQR